MFFASFVASTAFVAHSIIIVSFFTADVLTTVKLAAESFHTVTCW